MPAGAIVMAMHFATDTFQEGLETLLAAADHGAADRDEVLATAARVRDGDPDSWLREWTATGGTAWADANHRPSARAFLHAATYYAAPLALIGDTDGSVSEPALWRRQRVCWERAVELLGGEPVEIPYAGTTLPGYFFRAAPVRRPLVVIDHGGRQATSQAWVDGGAEAQARGFHWMTFDGPGRQAALFERGLVLRPDWEAVITPVADAMAARDDVDERRIALLGLEHAGYGVPRALAYEHRFAAAAVVPGVLDVSTLWTDALPDSARLALLNRDRHTFDREIRLAGLFDPRANAILRDRGRWYGLEGRTPYDLYTRVRQFRLGDEVDAIDTPLLVQHANGSERRWPGQGRALYDRLPGPKQLTSSPEVLDWLAQTLDH